MPGPGGFEPVVQPFESDWSRYLPGFDQAIAKHTQLNEAIRETMRLQQQLGALTGAPAGSGGGRGADDIGKVNAAIREQLAALREVRAATGGLTAAQQADMAAVRSYGGVIADLADRQRALAAVTGAGTDVIAAHAEQVRGAAGAAGDLAAAQAEAGASARAWAADVAEGTRVLRESSAAAGVLSEAMGPSGGGGGGAYLAGSLGAVRDAAREATAAVTETAAAIGAVHAAAATTAAAGLGGSLTDIGRQLDQIALGAGYASYRDLMRASYGGSAAAAAGAAAARGGGAGGGGTAAAAALGSALGSGPGGGLSSGTLDLMDLLGSSQGYHAGVSLPLLLAALGSGSAVASMLSGRGGAILSGLGSGIGGALGAAGGSLAGFAGGATRGLFAGGATASTQWAGTASAIATWYPRIHWAMMLTNEVLATAGPAAIAALAGTAVGMEGGQTAFDRLTGVNAVGQSIGGSLGQTPGQFLGLGDALQTAQTKADPQVWELMGAAINSVRASTDSASGGLGNFWNLGTNTIAMMDRFGAQVTLDFKQGLGTELAGAVQGGTQDLQQFGDVLGNVGDTLLHVIPSLPGVGSDLLSTLQFATKGLSDVAAFGTSTGLLGPALALEAGARYGPAIVGAGASLIGRVGQGFTAAGATGVGGFLGTAARKATAADVGVTLNPATGAVVASEGELIGGTGVAGALGGASALDVGLLAGATYLGAKAVTYKTPEQQSAGALQSQVGTDSFTQAIADIASGINQLTPAAATPPSGLGVQAANWPVIGGVVSTAMDIGHDFRTGGVASGISGLFRDTIGGLILGPPPTSQQAAQSGISGLTSQYQELLGAGKQIAQTFKVSVPEAFALADQAGLQLSTAFGAHGTLTPVALQQIMNTQTGLQAMTGGFGSGVYNTGVNAIQVAKGLAGSQLSTLNTAYDQLVQNATQGTTAATGFSGGLAALADLALPAAKKIPSSETVKGIERALGVTASQAQQIAASGGTAHSVKSIADALTGFSSQASQAAWAAYSSTSTTSPGMIQTVETMMDQLRTAQASNVLSQQQVAGAGAYEARQLLPYARYSPAALSQLGIISQEMGGPAYQPGESQAKNYAAISGAIDKASVSAKGYTAIQNTMAEGMSDVSQQALSFSSVLSSDVVDSMAAGATGAAGGNKAMREFAGSLKGGASGFDTSALKGVVSQMKESGESLSSIKLMIGDVGALKGVSASALAAMVRDAAADYQPKAAPHPDTTATQDQVRSIAGAHAANVHKAGQLAAASATRDQVRSIAGAHAAVEYKSKVDPPVVPPPPHGGTVEYDSRLKMPVIPHIPNQSFDIVGHIFTVGGGGVASSTMVGSGGGMRLTGQHGMLVPGNGGGDRYPALLEGGEAVVPRHLVPAIAPFLSAHRVPGFQAGGFAGAEGFGPAALTYNTMFAAMEASLEGMLGTFESGLSQALDGALGSSRGPFGGGMFQLGRGTAGGAPAGTPQSPVAVELVSGAIGGGGASAGMPGALPVPAAAQKVIDAFEKTFKGMGNPWGGFASQIMQGLLDSVKDASKETSAEAKALTAKVTREVNYARNVASAAAQGTGYGSAGLLGTFGNLATPTTTAQGQPYQYYTDQQNAAAGGTLSVQQQMSDYLQAEKSFTADLGKLSRGGLNKSLQQQLLAAGPLQGDQMAQSILGGAGGAGGANKLWSQIGKASNALGIGGAEGVYGYGGVGASKSVKVGVHTDAAAAQSAIDAIHGKSVVISVKLDMSGGGGAGAGVSLTAAQVKQVVEQVQASLLQQAKRNRKTGLTLPGYGS